MRTITPKLILFSLVFVVVAAPLVFGIQAILLVKQVQSNNFVDAASTAQFIQPAAATANLLTFNTIPLLRGTTSCTKLVPLSAEISPLIPQDDSLLRVNLSHLNQIVTTHDHTIAVCLNSVANSTVLKHFIPEEIKPVFIQVATDYSDFKQVLTNLATTDQTWLVLFQNSDELRATGGFTGTYALLTITDGQVAELVFEDIYDADGQFQGYVEPPPGVAEYLSSDNGLRLPDANWHPDVPQSVRQQLDFFALGRKQDIAGVITINLPLAERLLQVTGPITVPDYNAVVSAQNLHQALRDERDSFFAGNIQKKHLLSLVVKQALFKASELSMQQYVELLSVLKSGAKQKEVLLYSRDASLQQLFTKHQLTGAIDPSIAEQLIGLVESNVGINKANRQVQRTVTLQLSEQRSSITINFANNNSSQTLLPETGLIDTGYVNYQRIVVPTTWNVHAISLEGLPVEQWDEDIITTSTDHQIKQVGYLVPVPMQAARTTTIELTHPPLASPTSLQLYKQPGLQSTPYQITFGDFQTEVFLEHDQVLVLE